MPRSSKPLTGRIDPFRRDTEIALAALRTAFLALVVLSPQFLHAQGQGGMMLTAVAIAAAGYNVVLFYLHMQRLPFPRAIIVALDTLLITLWVYFSGPGNDQYFVFYFAVIFVAGIWFQRSGVIATALAASVLYVWAITQAPMPEDFAHASLRIVGLQVFVLMATAGLVSIAAGVQHADRMFYQYSQARLEESMNRVRMAQYVDNLIRPQKLPAAPGLDIGVRFRPAGAGVSGDYYDVFPLGERRWGFVVGDVRSKEEMALAYLPIFKSSLRLNARADRSPAAVLTQVNREVTTDMEERGDLEGFIGMCYAVIDLDQGTLTYANAGMEAGALHLAQTGHVISLSARGLVLGVERGVDYEEETWAIHQGDVLALFSDGLTEAFNRQGEMLGRDRLVAQWEAALSERNADAIAHRTFMYVMEEYSMGARRRDDSTLLVVRVTASDVGPQPEPSAV